MKVGVAMERITPRAGIDLSGFVLRTQPSVGICDELHVRVLCLEENARRLIWIHCDLIGFSNSLAWDIRNGVAASSGVPPEAVLISATHTHSGPATLPLRRCGVPDPAYLGLLKERVMKGVEEAMRAMEDVSLLYSCSALDGVSRDRRAAGPNSHVDNLLPVLAFKRGDGSFAAVIANFAMHNVGLGSGSRMVSSDIAGFAANLAGAAISGNPLVLMTNGGCGNINPINGDSGYSRVERLGTILGDAIVEGIQKLDPCHDSGLGFLFRKAELPLTQISLEELDRMMDGHRQCHLAHRDDAVYEAMKEWSRDTKPLILKGRAPAAAEGCVHIFKIGPVFFAGMNAEVFSRMAGSLRKASGIERLFVVGYADGCIGYLPPREIYPEGGYEVDLAYKFYGNFMVAPGGFELLRDTTLESLATIRPQLKAGRAERASLDGASRPERLRTPARKSKRRFTLVELLVVLVVIIMLVSMLLPALKNARDSVKSTVCKSNERHIGILMMNYVQDNNGWLPAGDYNASNAQSMPEDWVWNEAVWNRDFWNPKPTKYERGAMFCPSDPISHPSYSTNDTSYAANNLLFEVMGNPVTGRHHRQTEARPGIVIAGEMWSSAILLGRGQVVIKPTNASNFIPYPGGLASDHFKGGNYLFPDGHVAWSSYRDILVKESNGKYRFWTP